VVVTKEAVEEALRGYTDPYLGCDLLTARAVKGLTVADGRVSCPVSLGFPFGAYGPALQRTLEERLGALPGVVAVEVRIACHIESHAAQQGLKPLPGVKNILAIASGKGGVGKSTTATNLAIALQQEGATVGLLDADIYGPSQPRMLGASGAPEVLDGKHFEPLRAHGIQTISIGNLVDEETPMIWRGPMVTNALQQLLLETRWEDLDYLLVDLPPGTGDIQLTLCQRIPVSGAIVVTTPQDIALIDARKAVKMFEKVEVPVLGVVENMSVYTCPHCGHAEHLFGSGGGERMARQYGIEFLGALPLDPAIREGVDNGRPTMATAPESAVAGIYREVARKAAALLARRAKDSGSRFPRIVVKAE
jgi:ATP-binding protein involved in chromosome partitioning